MISAPVHVPCQICGATAYLGRDVRGQPPMPDTPSRGYRQRGLPPLRLTGPLGGPCKTPPRCARWHAKSKGGSDEPPMDSAPVYAQASHCGATAWLSLSIGSARCWGVPVIGYALGVRSITAVVTTVTFGQGRDVTGALRGRVGRIPLARASDTGSARQGLRGLPRVGPSPTPGGRPLRTVCPFGASV